MQTEIVTYNGREYEASAELRERMLEARIAGNEYVVLALLLQGIESGDLRPTAEPIAFITWGKRVAA